MEHQADEGKQIPPENLWKQLANTISIRSAQDNILWMQFGVFSAANAVLLVALFANGKLPHGVVGLIISLIGIGLSFVSCKIQLRGLGHIERLEKITDRLEQWLIELKQLQPDIAVSGFINKEEYQETVGSGIRARTWMKNANIAWIVLWLIGFGFVLGRLIIYSI